ncbi:MAG TPA: CDP-alcohol phosphatidyltransferase family protein [Gaiellaceae bacterium]|nr:CDP-alcohol phosphatidyltransferase family protein [Gaiellaceae bacterium]
MTISTGNASSSLLDRAGTTRPVQEVSVAAFFGPLADLVVRLLLPLRIPPAAMVLVHAWLGLAAAFAIHEGALLAAAALLQLKTLLDNADGRLARASGRVSLLGRYLDTEADFLVNAALFAALASATGAPWHALAAFVVLTLVLSVEFNIAGLYCEARGRALELPPPSGGPTERALARVYERVFAPQDRLVRSLSSHRLGRVLEGETDPERALAAKLAYYDRATVTVLANLGLSTQLLALGVFLVFEWPVGYLWLVVTTLGLLPLLQLRRERLARRALMR